MLTAGIIHTCQLTPHFAMMSTEMCAHFYWFCVVLKSPGHTVDPEIESRLAIDSPPIILDRLDLKRSSQLDSTWARIDRLDLRKVDGHC
jgi:hypothetical protein